MTVLVVIMPPTGTTDATCLAIYCHFILRREWRRLTYMRYKQERKCAQLYSITLGFRCLYCISTAGRAAHNYAPVTVGVVLTYSLGFWVISARRLFAGPIKQIAGASALCPFFVDLVSTDDKWLACTEEEMGISITESAVKRNQCAPIVALTECLICEACRYSLSPSPTIPLSSSPPLCLIHTLLIHPPTLN